MFKKILINQLLDTLDAAKDEAIERAAARIVPIVEKHQSQPNTLLSGDGMVAAYAKARIKRRLNDRREGLGDKLDALYTKIAAMEPADIEEFMDEVADNVIDELVERLGG